MTEQEFMEKYSSQPYNDNTDDLLKWASQIEGETGFLALNAQKALLRFENKLRELGFVYGGAAGESE